MDWLEPALRNETYGWIALGVAGATLLPGLLVSLIAAWFSWRAARLGKLARRFHGHKQLAEEQISSFDQEEKDLQRMMKEIEKAAANG
jgi:type VI protein secretion system component VasK